MHADHAAADGSPHVVAVGATLDPAAGLARVITSGTSAKVRHVLAGAARVAICQVDGPRWSTLEGTAVIREDRRRSPRPSSATPSATGIPRPNPHGWSSR